MKGLMNNEYLLYKLIKDNKDFCATDAEVAKMIGKSPASVAKYRYKLVENGFIEYKVAFTNNAMKTFYRLTKKKFEDKLEW